MCHTQYWSNFAITLIKLMGHWVWHEKRGVSYFLTIFFLILCLQMWRTYMLCIVRQLIVWILCSHHEQSFEHELATRPLLVLMITAYGTYSLHFSMVPSPSNSLPTLFYMHRIIIMRRTRFVSEPDRLSIWRFGGSTFQSVFTAYKRNRFQNKPLFNVLVVLIILPYVHVCAY